MRAKPIASVSVSSSHIKEVTQALLKLKRTKVYVGIADSGKANAEITLFSSESFCRCLNWPAVRVTVM